MRHESVLLLFDKGLSMIRILCLAAFFSFGYAISSSQEQPYNGTPQTIPGVIKAAEYDIGGEGVAYHDLDTANQGGQFRLHEGVDLETCTEGGYDVGWMNTGEWIHYTVSVLTKRSTPFRYELRLL
jgi:hypothetical protein